MIHPDLSTIYIYVRQFLADESGVIWINPMFGKLGSEKITLGHRKSKNSDGEDGNARDLPLAFGQQTFGYPLVNRCKQHVWLENQHLEIRL